MNPEARIFVAGHRGLVGSSIARGLAALGYSNLLFCASHELDLRDRHATDRFFAETKPEYVFLAAAKVGGIFANSNYPVDFLHCNLSIQESVIAASHRHGVRRMLFLGSSCIYPKRAPQPLKESYLLTGPLEASNRPYALAKIAGIELCWSYNRQYGCKFLAAMPTNLYGPGDTYHPENSHVIPGLLRKFHEAKVNGAPTVTVWGSGTPRREFLYVDDMAHACIHLMNLDDSRFDQLLGNNSVAGDEFEPPLINIGAGKDLTIRALAELIAEITGYSGNLKFDPTRPDGTMRKLLDVTRINSMGWRATTELKQGLATTYKDYCANVTESGSSAPYPAHHPR